MRYRTIDQSILRLRREKKYSAKVEAGLLPRPKPQRFDRTKLKEIFEKIGTSATLKLIENKAYLHIWRNSSPHNWWISPKNDEDDYIWHSDSDIYTRKVPPLKCFVGVSEEGKVCYPGGGLFQGYDSGMAQWSKYIINKKLIGIWNRMPAKMKCEIKKRYKK